MNAIVKAIGRTQEKENIPVFEIGDTLDVHVRIVEGDKERTQIFTGTVIAMHGIKVKDKQLSGDINASYTCRRMVGANGVERTFPLHCPNVEKINVKRRTVVRRSKLYYLRNRIGKAARLKERRVVSKKQR
jgi:large subunit ribosomal protein L19